jgi:hypothetical protein
MKKFKSHVNEASYAGNIGIMELIKFKQKASNDQKKQLDSHIQNKRHKEAWNLVRDVTGVNLHKSVNEEKKVPNPDILPPSGAGQDGTDHLVKSYMRDTPGQNYKKFKDYIK